ncbi:XAC2610-related protein [uncultured Oscillibacter sp.]|uniref:XAC2610-related protein n=2 Tax=uncultured Oscillibacter sp. TaxID=876091 RepID=UPI00261F56DD|nr:hypothetical protein [uncultured Oscillibacter sp.]
MRPAIFKTLLSAFFILLLCACQADGGHADDPGQGRPAEVQQLIQAYSPTITDCAIEDAEFSLIYLDDDAVPELVILDRYHNRYSIYTIKDGSAVCLVDYITTVEMTYYERLGVISAFYRWNGGGDEGGYASEYYQLDQHSETLTDDSTPDFQFTYQAAYDENGQWTGTGTTSYFAQGEEIDEAAYQQILADFDLSQAEEKSCFSEDNDCFTKDEILTYLGIEAPTKAAKSPEQLLAEQPIDDTHDAFLIDTGGKLGTLLVTAELDAESPVKDCRATVRFTVWDPDAMDEPLQTITAATNIFLDWSIIDANFDGYADFTCTYLRGNQPYYDHLWIWSEEHRQFEGVPEYDEISAPELDAETGTIYGFNRSSAGGTGLHTFHQWINGNLTCVRQIKIDSSPADTVRMSVQDRIAGELAEIYHEDFSLESGGWQDAQMAWHDLDYHGEPGGIYDLFQQQPVDDTHDAFLVSTGGMLGTLLVTAELAMENKNEFGARDITFSVWNPADMEQPIQTFSEEFMMGVRPEFHHMADANFDGYQDFGYLFSAGNQPNYWHYWLWDEDQGQFQYCAPLVEISQPGFDPERQVITGWARSSGAGDGINTFHRWEDGELICVRRVESFSSREEPSIVCVQDRIDGELQQVYREEFPWPGEEPEGQEVWRQARYKWCDLDYHGESS